MSIVQVIRAATYPTARWKNGGGITSEVAAYPPGAGMEDFLWRLSLAQVDWAGHFSKFSGVDRALAVMDGTLALTGPDFEVLLDDQTAPFRFDGEACVHGDPIGGRVCNLNAMVRRGAYGVAMARLDRGDVAACAGMGFLVATQPQTCGGHRLDRMDCVLIEEQIQVEGRSILVDFTAA